MMALEAAVEIIPPFYYTPSNSFHACGAAERADLHHWFKPLQGRAEKSAVWEK